MPEPRRVRLGLKLKALGRTLVVHSVDTGVPHAVVVVDSVEKVDVPRLGRALRNHPAFRPRGANVDFAAFGRNGLSIRTYERGVEAETLACGTGAVAAAVVGHLLGKCRPPVRIVTRGGDVLTARFTPPSGRDIWLEGPARLVFTGEADL